MPKEENQKERIMEEEPIDFFLGDSRKWVIAIVVLLVLLGAIGGYYIHALKSVRMDRMSITKIGLDDGGNVIVLEGELRLYNPSALPLDIESIDYDIVIDGKSIGFGTMRGDRIPSGTGATMRFEQNIDLFELTPDVIALAGKNGAQAMMRGTITMVFLGVRIKLPFREEQDIGPLIESEIKAVMARQRESGEDIARLIFP